MHVYHERCLALVSETPLCRILFVTHDELSAADCLEHCFYHGHVERSRIAGACVSCVCYSLSVIDSLVSFVY
jgi:hypothetical protein